MTSQRKRVFPEQSKFKKGVITCPVCYHEHHWKCRVTEDEGLALCSCIPSAKQAKDGRYVHILKQHNNKPQKQSVVSAPPIKECGIAESYKATIDHCNKVYSDLLNECLVLRSDHANNLLEARGLSDGSVGANSYASTPLPGRAREICDALSEKFNLAGVPGFYRDEKDLWQMNIKQQGLFIPIRDAQGRIAACQIRCDAGDIRYIWFSSNGRSDGASSGAPFHFAKPDLVRLTGNAFITEGALKADVIAEVEQSAVIGLPGVLSFNSETLSQQLNESLPELQTLFIVFDSDWREKKEVKKALFRLIASLRQSGITLTVRTWDSEVGKGYDDFLTNKERATSDE
jgi:DNA primase